MHFQGSVVVVKLLCGKFYYVLLKVTSYNCIIVHS